MMERRLIGIRAIGIALVFSVALSALAQTRDQMAKRSDEIIAKVRKIELLNQILPVVMTKEQIKAILPPIEKARDQVRKAQKSEYEFLLKTEPEVDKVYKAAIEKGKIPSLDEFKDLATTFRSMAMARAGIAEENADKVIEIVEKQLNAGQKKAMANALKPQKIDPSIDPTKLDEKGKMKFFVKFILLDPLSYDLLLELSK